MSYIKTQDGFTFIGRHATNLESNLTGGTRSSVFLIISGGEGCLIDTGITEEVSRIIGKMIEESGCSLKYIVLTHDHFDHVANCSEIKERFGGTVVAHPLDMPMLENPLLLFSEDASQYFPQWSLQNLLEGMSMSQENWGRYRQIISNHIFFPQYVDKTVVDGDVLTVGEVDLEIAHTPGHSPGSLSVYNRSSLSLYVGDLLLGPGRPFPIGNYNSYERSLLKVKNFRASFLGVGHEPPAIGFGKVRKMILGKIIDSYKRETGIIQALSSKNFLNVEDLSDIIFPEYKRNRQYPNRDFSTYCHLLKLQNEGIITRFIRDGVTRWKLADAENQ